MVWSVQLELSRLQSHDAAQADGVAWPLVSDLRRVPGECAPNDVVKM